MSSDGHGKPSDYMPSDGGRPVREASWFPECVVIPCTTACKHTRDQCGACGTTSRRDVRHTTCDGRGKVARIRR